jgi:hypothetical protein
MRVPTRSSSSNPIKRTKRAAGAGRLRRSFSELSVDNGGAVEQLFQAPAQVCQFLPFQS